MTSSIEPSPGTLDLSLLHVVCGASARFLSDKDEVYRDRAASWTDQAEADTLTRTNMLSIASLQTLLIIFERSASRQFGKVYMLSAMAARIAYVLCLNFDKGTHLPAVRESRKQLMWSIFVLDKFFAGGIPDFTLCPASTLRIGLPCNERNFELNIETETEGLTDISRTIPPSTLGSKAYLIRLLDIRDQILRYVVRQLDFSLEASSANVSKVIPNKLLPAQAARSIQNRHSKVWSKSWNSFVNHCRTHFSITRTT
jgi:hypothetical protein